MTKIKSIYLNKDLIKMAKITSEKLGIELHLVILAYKSYFDCIKETFESIDYSSIKSEDDLKTINSSFNVNGIGKFYTSFKIIDKLNNRKFKNEDSKYKESNTNVYTVDHNRR